MDNITIVEITAFEEVVIEVEGESTQEGFDYTNDFAVA